MSQHSDKWGQGGEPKVAFDEFGSSEGLVYILSSLHGCVLMSKGTVNRSRELTSRGAEMDVGSSVSCCFICYLEWPVGSLGKRLSHLCLFKDTCFVSSWAFSFCGRLSLSWLNPELLIHIRVLNNWTHVNRYSLKTAVDPCSSLSGTNTQSCGAYFVHLAPLWRPMQQRADSLSYCFGLVTSISMLWTSSCTGPAVKEWGFLPPPLQWLTSEPGTIHLCIVAIVCSG